MKVCWSSQLSASVLAGVSLIFVDNLFPPKYLREPILFQIRHLILNTITEGNDAILHHPALLDNNYGYNCKT